MTRTVLFVEMPNFYANIERADHPELVDRPIIVGGDPRKKGLVQSATADAIAAGVKLEMPVIDAMRRCPEARAFRTNMVRYREVSRQLFAWLRRGVEQLEPFGLAAAFFDLTGLGEPPYEIAKRLQGLVHREIGLPIRAGLGTGKMIARLASEEAGEGAIRQIAAGDERAFLELFPVTRLEGVGEKTAQVLAELGARTIGEVATFDPAKLEAELGSRGLQIAALAAGWDDRRVRSSGRAQSVSRDSGVREGTCDGVVLAEQIQELANGLAAELGRQGLTALKVALKLDFVDQAAVTRSLTLSEPVAAVPEIQAAAMRLLERSNAGSRAITRLRLQLAELQLPGAEDRQLDLFSTSS
jgi:DNA polymerase-4